MWQQSDLVPKPDMPMGGKFAYAGDAAETPDTLQALYEFDIEYSEMNNLNLTGK